MDEINVACIRSKEIAARFATDGSKMQRHHTWKAIAQGTKVKKVDRPKFAYLSQKAKPSDFTASNKHVSNYLVDHQVHAALAKTAHFQVNNDFEGIQHNYGNRLHGKQF